MSSYVKMEKYQKFKKMQGKNFSKNKTKKIKNLQA